MTKEIRRLAIAGTTSGVGKTSITCAIIHELQKNGEVVKPFKVGPDYIDPIYLGAAAGGSSAYNLDPWIMGDDCMLESFVRHSDPAGISIMEGVMGYYDGHSGDSETASTYHVAAATRTPVLLVVDASRAARSVAATVHGFLTFHKESWIAGVILNKLGSKKHATLCTKALRQRGIKIAGCIMRDRSIELEERHLGLHSTMSSVTLQGRIEKIADVIVPNLDMKVIQSIVDGPADLPTTERKQPLLHRAVPIKRPVIAVAQDASFNFYYKDNLEALRREGADLAFFSPVNDDTLPACDGLYIGGGFPEILAEPLKRNLRLRTSIKKAAQDGMPVYAECGGLMYLARHIITRDEDGHTTTHQMTGLIDADVTMTNRPTLNYTSGMMKPHTPITGGSRRCFHGHEFHYSRMLDVAQDTRFALKLDEGEGIIHGMDGITLYNMLASYGHLYFDYSDFAGEFVSSCTRYART